MVEGDVSHISYANITCSYLYVLFMTGELVLVKAGMVTQEVHHSRLAAAGACTTMDVNLPKVMNRVNVDFQQNMR